MSQQEHDRQVFQHLFPGNDYDQLPSLRAPTLVYLSGKAVWAFLNVVSGIGFNFDENAMMVAGRHFTERENFPQPDKVLTRYLIGNLVPIEARVSVDTFNGHSFADLVRTDQGEKLGRAASRPFTATPIADRLVKIAEDSSDRQQENIIGILNRKNQVAGLIRFIENPNREQPRRVRRRVKVVWWKRLLPEPLRI